MVTLIIAFFMIISSLDLEFIRHETVVTKNMRECREMGDNYPMPADADTFTYLCVENK